MLDIKGQILAECERSLKHSMAVATKIEVFAVVVNYNGIPLLQRKFERGSPGKKDLSEKWGMIGGGVEISHLQAADNAADLTERYQGAILRALKQEFKKEAGLELLSLPKPLLLSPAWFLHPYTDTDKKERISIDLAFSFPIPMRSSFIRATPEFEKKGTQGELKFIPHNKLLGLDIVSPKIRFLIEGVIDQVHRRK